ncbi:uncharacterized protein LOC111705587 [Eurytemora carolleeae]|uniref:uncharacterized protein LOC111705587 n=1 Tax=Eurytemora carolleeae TaxID=1294199 RepID=UPI000C75D614|nr:uncharacterized protein LOC111705587 [Eurytemora carolleeae]|eukprot:XP_023333947.1 uncharacterized protein LOC111705587 [Eurytemora affinis]
MDLNAKELIVFLTDPTAAATNIAISTGYYILNVVTFLVMASFGTFGEDEETILKKTDVDPVNTYDALDGKLSFQGMAITTLVNVVLAFGAVLFWVFMSYFPSAAKRKQDLVAQSSLNFESDELKNSEQTLYNSIEYYDSL